MHVEQCKSASDFRVQEFCLWTGHQSFDMGAQLAIIFGMAPF